MNRYTSLILFIIALFVLMAVAGCVPEYPYELKDPVRAPTMASSLRNAYIDNPVNFNLHYRGNIVSVYGTVDVVKPDGKVAFRDNLIHFGELICTFEDQQVVAELKSGDNIIITGVVHEINGWLVMLTRCKLDSIR